MRVLALRTLVETINDEYFQLCLVNAEKFLVLVRCGRIEIYTLLRE
jgi:hypothetical protein